MRSILAEAPLTEWCFRTAHELGLSLGPAWAESAGGNRICAEFALGESASEESSPLQAHCMVSTGSSSQAENAIALALDLVMSLPWPATSPEDSAESTMSGGKFSASALIEPCEITTRSAVMAAKKAATELIGLDPKDGHIALWLATAQSLEEAVDLTPFPAVGNQAAQSEVSVFATLPLEPGQDEHSPDFSTSLRALVVELIHELLRSSQRRDYIEFLHKLRDRP